MGPFKVTDADRMVRILQTFGRLDEIRWSYSPNYNLINYCDPDLSADEKLLTHWLCYIMDRQMPFMRIWDIGGYVLSHLVREYSRSSDHALDILKRYIDFVRRSSGIGAVLRCPLEGPNPRLARREMEADPVQFASRYIPEDIVLIFRTLAILQQVSDRSLVRFISLFAPNDMGMGGAVRQVAVALDGLTYSAAGAISTTDLPEKLDEMAMRVSEEAGAILEDGSTWLAEKTKQFRPYGKKRLWCSWRDFLKSPEFNEQFVQAMGGVVESGAERWRREDPDLRNVLDRLELPGDIWNNNTVFRDGLFMPYLANKRKTWDMPQTVREIYDILTDRLRGTFHPDQLDVTFDFVPRMCERGMCHVCPFGQGVTRLCHRQEGILCPIPLVTCGYDHVCNPAECGFRDDSVKGTCSHAG